MITPVLLISACGSLVLSTSTRLGRVIDRVRQLPSVSIRAVGLLDVYRWLPIAIGMTGIACRTYGSFLMMLEAKLARETVMPRWISHGSWRGRSFRKKSSIVTLNAVFLKRLFFDHRRRGFSQVEAKGEPDSG